MRKVSTVCIVLCFVFGLLAVYAALCRSHWGVVILSFIGIEALVMAVVAKRIEAPKGDEKRGI